MSRKMMGHSGESSRKTPGDPDDGNGKPFKKARYVWEVKGKYHLKNGAKRPTQTDNLQSSSSPVASSHNYVDHGSHRTHNSDSDSDDEALNNNNCAMNNNDASCNDRCCMAELVSQKEIFFDHYAQHDRMCTNDIEKSIADEIPVTLVIPSNRNTDEYLHKWQARQMAKSFVDNTINSILEHWKIAPFDCADFVENCENGEQVEDEGIMMAIQSHGLQSGGVRNDHNIQTLPAVDLADDSAMDENMVTSTMDNTENQQVEFNRTESMEGSEESLSIDDPMDFLNQAVSVAIQKKGLSSYNYG